MNLIALMVSAISQGIIECCKINYIEKVNPDIRSKLMSEFSYGWVSKPTHTDLMVPKTKNFRSARVHPSLMEVHFRKSPGAVIRAWRH
jgi:hypothetical protein